MATCHVPVRGVKIVLSGKTDTTLPKVFNHAIKETMNKYSTAS